MVFDAQLASIKGFRTAGGSVPRLEVLPLAQRYAALTTSLLVLSAEYEVRCSHLLMCCSRCSSNASRKARYTLSNMPFGGLHHEVRVSCCDLSCALPAGEHN